MRDKDDNQNKLSETLSKIETHEEMIINEGLTNIEYSEALSRLAKEGKSERIDILTEKYRIIYPFETSRFHAINIYNEAKHKIWLYEQAIQIYEYDLIIKEFKEAIRHFDAALAQEPDDLELNYSKADTFIEVGKLSTDSENKIKYFQWAIPYLNNVIKFDPNHNFAKKGLNEINTKLKSLRSIINLQPQPNNNNSSDITPKPKSRQKLYADFRKLNRQAIEEIDVTKKKAFFLKSLEPLHIIIQEFRGSHEAYIKIAQTYIELEKIETIKAETIIYCHEIIKNAQSAISCKKSSAELLDPLMKYANELLGLLKKTEQDISNTVIDADSFVYGEQSTISAASDGFNQFTSFGAQIEPHEPDITHIGSRKRMADKINEVVMKYSRTDSYSFTERMSLESVNSYQDEIIKEKNFTQNIARQ